MSNVDLSRLDMKTLLQQDIVIQNLRSTLGNKTEAFMASLMDLVNTDRDLSTVDQRSVISAALVSATLNLPFNANLGYMWLIPYKNKAKAQMGYKGYIQLALRSGQYQKLNAVTIYDGELSNWNPLEETYDYDPANRQSDQAVGYLAYFKLNNGFEKRVYWTKAMIENHRQHFSQGNSKTWRDDYDAMAIKTVIKSLISKWGPMTVDLQNALAHDVEEYSDEPIMTNGTETSVPTPEPQLMSVDGQETPVMPPLADAHPQTKQNNSNNVSHSLANIYQGADDYDDNQNTEQSNFEQPEPDSIQITNA